MRPIFKFGDAVLLVSDENVGTLARILAESVYLISDDHYDYATKYKVAEPSAIKSPLVEFIADDRIYQKEPEQVEETPEADSDFEQINGGI